MADNDRVASKREPSDNEELWHVEMCSESGYNSFCQKCIIKDSRLWVPVPGKPMIIHIERPPRAQDSELDGASNQEASPPTSPGTTSDSDYHTSKSHFSSDQDSASDLYHAANGKPMSYEVAQLEDWSELYRTIRATSKMNGAAGPYRQVSKMARNVSATTDLSIYTGGMLPVDGMNEAPALKKVQERVKLDEDTGEPTRPVTGGDTPNLEAFQAMLSDFKACLADMKAFNLRHDAISHSSEGSTPERSAGEGLPGSS